jgi:hypothetical protein
MINFDHYQNAKDILDNYPIYDDGDTFKITYEFNGKSFTINMKYFFKDEILFGFIHYDVPDNNYDDDSSYLVGYIIERYVITKCGNIRCTFTFYTDDDIPKYHYYPTFGLNHISFFDTTVDIKSTKYSYYMASNHNFSTTMINFQPLIDFLDNEI